MTWWVALLLAGCSLLLCLASIASAIAAIPGNPSTASTGLKIVGTLSVCAVFLFGLGVAVFLGWGVGLLFGVF